MDALAKYKQKIVIVLAVCVFLLSVLQISYNIRESLDYEDLIDFTVYREAEEKYWQGQNPYLFTYVGKQEIPFNYPPSTLLLLTPLSVIPKDIAMIVLTVVSFLGLWFTFWLIPKLLKIPLSTPHLLIVLALINQTFPVKFTLILGQINLIVLAISFGALALYKGAKHMHHWIVSAFLLAIAAGLKLFPLAVMPLFALRKDIRFTLLVPLIFFVLNIIASFDLVLHYYGSANQLSVSFPEKFYDQSIFAMLLRLTGNDSVVHYVGGGIVLLLYVIAIFLSSRAGLVTSFATIFAITSISNPFSWQHRLVFAYPLIFILYLTGLPQQKTAMQKMLYYGVFLAIWLIFLLHEKHLAPFMYGNRLLASYQTITILALIVVQLVISARKLGHSTV